MASFLPDDDLHPRSLPALVRRAAMWSVICIISAAPSFLWAQKGFDRGAMATGVVLFIGPYTAFTSTDAFIRFKNRPFMRRTLYIGYLTRVGASAIYPVGMAGDLVPGLFSINVANQIGVDGKTFLGTLIITVVQGAILNVILSGFMALVYTTQRLFMKPPTAMARGFEVLLTPPPPPPLPDPRGGVGEDDAGR